jgi:hypothetical protein
MRLLFLLLVFASSAFAAVRGDNLLTNGGFESAAGWGSVGGGYTLDAAVAHSGKQSLRCQGQGLEESHGAMQVITLDPPLAHPFRISAWSRAEQAEVGQDYDVYLDLFYAGGTPLWGQIARFRSGTHGWEPAVCEFEVAKPVKRIEVYVLFRKAKGTVWFDDIEVSLKPFTFTQLDALPDPFGAGSLAILGGTSLPARWQASLAGPGSVRPVLSGTNRPIRASWAKLPLNLGAAAGAGTWQLRVEATDAALAETITTNVAVQLGTQAQPRPYVLWTESSMSRVMPHAIPKTVPSRASYRLPLAGGEYGSFQIVLLPQPGEGLKEVEVGVNDLVDAKSHQRIAATNLHWHLVGYVQVDQPARHPALNDAAAGWWPDPLLPVERFDVPADWAQPLWVTVYAPPGTRAGEYTGHVTIRSPGTEPRQVALTVSIYDFSLPTTGHLKTAFALMDGFLERVYGAPLTLELRQRYGDYVLAHRLNPDDISRTAPPALDDLRHYRDRGLNAFNVLNMVEERGRRPWVCFSELSAYTPKFKQRLIERLDPYVDALRRESLGERAYIYTFDERGPEFFPVIREYFGLVKERYPEVHTLTTAYVPQEPAVMRDLHVDWNCPVSSVYRFETSERCRAAGLQVWSYICCGPRYPYANWMVDDPLIEARVIWWQAYQQKMDGFLYWGLNIWDQASNAKPIDPGAGPLLAWSVRSGGPFYGDGRLLYPGKEGPIGSIRLANIRDGLEDYEYLWLLAERSKSREAAREACRPVAESLTEFSRDPAVLEAQREEIARRIQRMGPGPL